MTDIQSPDKPLLRRYVQPILYLADRMSEAEGVAVSLVRHTIESLALAAGMPEYRKDSGYRHLSDQRACDMLDNDHAKTAALVVITLILKTSEERKEGEYEYFSKIRTLLGSDPVKVPVDVREHKELALKYLTQPVEPTVAGRRPSNPQAEPKTADR